MTQGASAALGRAIAIRAIAVRAIVIRAIAIRVSAAAALRVISITALVVASAACATEPRTTFLAPGGPAGTLTDATERQVIAALGGVGLPAAEALLPYRPPEAALLANAPRTVLQATLPDDPAGGFVVIYALTSSQAAQAAATEQAEYIAGHRGGIFPLGTRPVLRVVGSNVVFFSWLPDTTPDARTRLVEEALLSVGSEVPVRA